MVADMGKGGRDDDEYMPEFTGDNSDNEGFEADNTPLKGLELEPDELKEVREGSSLGKKVVLGLVIVFATVLVSYYLVYQQKARIAQQAVGTPTTETAVAEVTTPAEPDNTTPEVAVPAVSTPAKETINLASSPLKKPELSASTTETKPATSTASQMEANAAEMIKAAEPATSATSASAAATSAQPASTTPAISATEAAPATPVASAAVATPATPALPATPEAPAATSTSVAGSTEAGSQATASSSLIVRITKLDDEVAALNTTVAALDKKLDALQTSGSGGKHNKNRSKPLTHSMEVASPASGTTMTPVSTPSYVVRAIVPGRAWIEASLGGPITISVGDHVPGMGVVKSLDSSVGEVTLESGEVIKYGPDDH